ncbi:MAG: DNA/RNA non-specific endonuclease [Erysipelotrichaceae bacterium]|nr:DNA/RNA non-specific endonuclease [Erysipelotrichaceae bacterium]MCF0259870.1 DNA/RNA non-specific endonuclease [Erysipelotrichaceae bacterium]
MNPFPWLKKVPALLLCLSLTACGSAGKTAQTPAQSSVPAQSTPKEEAKTEDSTKKETDDPVVSLKVSDIPAYSNQPYVTMNSNKPYFSDDELTVLSYESYASLDKLGRVAWAMASLDKSLMPTESRSSINGVKPTGWNSDKYDFIDGNNLYNRCHLIGFQLSGENANDRNLMTGTRYMNTEGMLPFENKLADYIKSTGNHVIYRVTPLFEGDNLVASGVLMEAKSVEDKGKGIEFNVYCYNVQPGVEIDYKTGSSKAAAAPVKTETAAVPEQAAPPAEEAVAAAEEPAPAAEEPEPDVEEAAVPEPTVTYIANANTLKFHRPDCTSVKQMADHNKVYYYGSRQEVTDAGFVPCKRCDP